MPYDFEATDKITVNPKNNEEKISVLSEIHLDAINSLDVDFKNLLKII